MGSGRTPLLRAIFGLENPTGGSVTVNKKPLTGGRNTPAMRLIEGVGYLSEDRKGDGLTLNLSVADNTTLTKFSSCSKFGWIDLTKQRVQTEKLVSELKIKTHNVKQAVALYQVEISKKSSWAAYFIRMQTYFCSMNPRAELILEARRRFTRRSRSVQGRRKQF
jgi:ABC-type lipopolysaccharide export system ATPase subunit